MLGIFPTPAGGRRSACRLRIGGPPVRVNPSIIRAETPEKTLDTRPRGPRTCLYSVVSLSLPDHLTERPYHLTSRPCFPAFLYSLRRRLRASLSVSASAAPATPCRAIEAESASFQMPPFPCREAISCERCLAEVRGSLIRIQR